MNIQMIEAAAARMQGHVRETPRLNAPLLDRIAGRRDLVKAECLPVGLGPVDVHFNRIRVAVRAMKAA
jgi:threonine dehydratase